MLAGGAEKQPRKGRRLLEPSSRLSEETTESKMVKVEGRGVAKAGKKEGAGAVVQRTAMEPLGTTVDYGTILAWVIEVAGGNIEVCESQARCYFRHRLDEGETGAMRVS